MNKETIERLKQELREVNERLVKLVKFLQTRKYLSLSYANCTLLKMQAEVMDKYADILTIRIELNEREVTK